MSSVSKKPPSLPPLPVLPKRKLTPPAGRTYIIDVEEDEATPAKNEVVSMYQSLISVYDSMTMRDRMLFIEFANVYQSLSPDDRRLLLAQANLLVKKRR